MYRLLKYLSVITLALLISSPVHGHSANSIERTLDRDSTIVSPIDTLSSGVITTAFTHHEAHEGKRFLVHEGFVLNSGGTASKEYLIITPNTTAWAHITLDVKGSLAFSTRFFEGTGKTGGTVMAEIDHNRNTANTATMIITHTPTGTEGAGTVLFTSRHGHPSIGGGRGGEGGGDGGRDELILKQNEKYSFTVTALSANDTNITVDIDWYEHVSGS